MYCSVGDPDRRYSYDNGGRSLEKPPVDCAAVVHAICHEDKPKTPELEHNRAYSGSNIDRDSRRYNATERTDFVSALLH